VLIFVTGAQGFIGRALVAALCVRGHAVLAGVHRRRPAQRDVRFVEVDFTRDLDPATWAPRLAGVDAVCNTVGILRERGTQTFARVHVDAPVALFDACARTGIRRVVQLSALGADADAATDYHRTKRAADDALLARIPSAWCAQPSLVFGGGGASARLFMMLASLPVIPVPGRGEQRVQPIHLDDLVQALCALLERTLDDGGRVALVGSAPITLRGLLTALRAGLGLPPAPVAEVPRPLVAAGAALGEHVPRLPLDRATLRMLERGNTADAGPTAALLGHAPRPVDAFIARDAADALRAQARLSWLLPILRASVGIVFIVTGVLSLGVFPAADSYALLERTGAPRALWPLLLYGAALLDLALGILVFVLHGTPRRWLWRAQAVLIVGYTVVITWRLPEFWLHPYGPVLKNLPLLAVLVVLDVLEERRR
jgi:uncharacterized protein YbjT (DUF2867 family)